MHRRRDYGAQGRSQDPISPASRLYFHCAFRFDNPMTRAHVRLLGPCFKTGRMGHRQNVRAGYHSSSSQTHQPQLKPWSASPEEPASLTLDELDASTLAFTVTVIASTPWQVLSANGVPLHRLLTKPSLPLTRIAKKCTTG